MLNELTRHKKAGPMGNNNHGSEVTVQEAAEQLGYHQHHVYRMLAQGVMKGRQWNRAWIIKQSEVDRIKALQDEHGRLPRSDRL